MINNSVFAILGLMIGYALILPIAGVIIWKNKTKEPLKPIIVGAITFFLFAMVLENIPKIILSGIFGNKLTSNLLILGPIAALLAGLFEETGRLVAFKTVLKEYKGKRTSITYGIGHGGFEVLLIISISAIQYLAYAVMIKNGSFNTLIAQAATKSPEAAAQLAGIPNVLKDITWSYLLLSIWERISAVAFHISMSVLVFAGIKNNKKSYYPLAIILHTLFDMVAVLGQAGIIKNMIIIESMIFAFSMILTITIFKLVYTKMKE